MLEFRKAMDASLQQDWASMAQQTSDYVNTLHNHFAGTVNDTLSRVDETRSELMDAYG